MEQQNSVTYLDLVHLIYPRNTIKCDWNGLIKRHPKLFLLRLLPLGLLIIIGNRYVALKLMKCDDSIELENDVTSSQTLEKAEWREREGIIIIARVDFVQHVSISFDTSWLRCVYANQLGNDLQDI